MRCEIGAGRSALPSCVGIRDAREVSALLEAADLVKSFRADGVERPVLRGLSIAVDRGAWIAVMGPSGSGRGIGFESACLISRELSTR